MKKSIIVPIIIVILVSAYLLLSSLPENVPEKQSRPVYDIDFTFYDVEKLQNSLALQNISMSTPSAITDHTIGKYCTFFDEDGVQKIVEYCTTTSLVSSNGKSLGNLNLGGTSDDGPIMALAVIDVPYLDSKKDEIHFVFQTMIETLVCDCWEQKQPGGFESVSDWMSIVAQKYIESSKPTLKSEISGLDNKKLILEITSKDGSYLWTLIVLKQV